ncbi:MAG: TetR/AcrR family transcriptional regulator [Proteobacteria bacterium]|nr:TetR/AcrR family transcriptional regulator [Pseudomonadota bacterium]
MNNITSNHKIIIEAAFLLLNSNPRATLAEIATSAGISRATLHRHFSGREDLIKAMAVQSINETDKAAEQASKNSQSYSDALEKIFTAMIPLGSRHWFLAQQAIADIPEIKQRLIRQQNEMADAIYAAIQENLFDHQYPIEWIVQCYDHMIHAAWEMIRGQHATVKQATDLAWQTLIYGLRSDK